MARARLPPGFRFHPTDEELVKYYLKRKVLRKKVEYIAELNIYKFSPWDLPEKSSLKSKDLEWYFFCPIERKYSSGSRMSRTAEAGFWKTTGKERPVFYNKQTVGIIKTLVFHQGRAPKGNRTDWVMHEYRIVDKDLADAGAVQDAFVLCKIFKKCGPGPKVGAQYGAPFNEEEWDDDEEEDGLSSRALPFTSNNQDSSATTSLLDPVSTCSGPLYEAGPSVMLPGADEPCALALTSNNQNSSATTSLLDPGSTFSGLLSEPGPSNMLPGADELHTAVPVGDDIDSMMDMFVEDDPLLPADNNDTVVLDNLHHEVVPRLDGNEMIYNGLGDITNWAQMADNRFGFSNNALNYTFPAAAAAAANDASFLELEDLDCPLTRYSDAANNGSECFTVDNLVGPSHYLCNYGEPLPSLNSVVNNSYGSTLWSPTPQGSINQYADHFNLFLKGNEARRNANNL